MAIGKVDTRIHFDGKDNHPAQQSPKDEVDINLIVERAKRGAGLLTINANVPKYGDFTGLPSYRDALMMVNKARDMFMSLDAFVRERFGNDPARLLDFLSDEKNHDEAVKLGLVNAPPAAPAPDEHLAALKSIDESLKASSGPNKHRPKADRD